MVVDDCGWIATVDILCEYDKGGHHIITSSHQ